MPAKEIVIDGVKYVPEVEERAWRALMEGQFRHGLALGEARANAKPSPTVADCLEEVNLAIKAIGDELRKPTRTVESVYKKPLSELKPPEGFEFTGEFRKPHGGEYVLSADFYQPGYAGERYPFQFPNGPRLILREKESAPTPRWVFESSDAVHATHVMESGIVRPYSSLDCRPGMTYLRLVEQPE